MITLLHPDDLQLREIFCTGDFLKSVNHVTLNKNNVTLNIKIMLIFPAINLLPIFGGV